MHLLRLNKTINSVWRALSSLCAYAPAGAPGKTRRTRAQAWVSSEQRFSSPLRGVGRPEVRNSAHSNTARPFVLSNVKWHSARATLAAYSQIIERSVCARRVARPSARGFVTRACVRSPSRNRRSSRRSSRRLRHRHFSGCGFTGWMVARWAGKIRAMR